MSLNQRQNILATAPAAPSLVQQVGMAGTAAVITVTFIHPIDVVKVSLRIVLMAKMMGQTHSIKPTECFTALEFSSRWTSAIDERQSILLN